MNCMDCLDRTNVVQAALARHIMEQQVNKMLNKEKDGKVPRCFLWVYAAN